VEKLYRVETYGPGHWPSLGEEAWLHLVVGNAISSLTDLSGNNAHLEDYIHRRCGQSASATILVVAVERSPALC
jgi:hypothetical protein